MVRIVDWSVSKRQNRAVTEFLQRIPGGGRKGGV